MVGDDVEREVRPTQAAGLPVFWIKDPEDPIPDLASIPQGTLSSFRDWLGKTDPNTLRISFQTPRALQACLCSTPAALDTLVSDLPEDHHLWQDEMFVPITIIARVKNFDEAMQRANDVQYGLTAGVYGSQEEVEAFYDQIQAGVTYANRPQGATTGAWPGFQPFGGWKGSGSTGKNSGGVYYLPLYMHEQIRNFVRKT